jgi:hypothetical protein
MGFVKTRENLISLFDSEIIVEQTKNEIIYLFEKN